VKVTIADYSRDWLGQFERERDELAKVLGETAATSMACSRRGLPSLIGMYRMTLRRPRQISSEALRSERWQGTKVKFELTFWVI